MSIESREFVNLRNDMLDAEAHRAGRESVEPIPDSVADCDAPESGRMGRCACCKERRFIPAGTHVCDDCAG